MLQLGYILQLQVKILAADCLSELENQAISKELEDLERMNSRMTNIYIHLISTV